MKKSIAGKMTVVAVVGVMAVALLGMAQCAMAQVKWDMTTEYAESNISGTGLATFAKLIGERAGGRLTIVPSYDTAKGVTSGQMIGAIRDGKIAGGDAFAGPLESTDSIFALPSLPFVTQSLQASERLNQLARPLYQKALAERGIKLLYVTIWPATGLWAVRNPATPADLKLLSVRTYDRSSEAVMRNAGATAAFLPFNDAMAKLKTGEINSVLSSGDGGAGRKLWDYLHGFTALNYATPISIAMISAADFNTLPKDLQAIVEQAAAETEAHQLSLLSDRTQQNHAQMRANGVAIQADVPPEVMEVLRRAAGPTVDAWRAKAGPDAQAILDAAVAR